jgi:hypothetical protein
MNFAHLHLLFNHVPVIGVIVGYGLFLTSFVGRGKNEDLRRGSLIVFVAIALLTVPAFLSGVGAQQMLKLQPGISNALMDRHEGAALLAFWFVEATGVFALVGLWQSQGASKPARWTTVGVAVLALVTVALLTRVGNTGGDIRHPEVAGLSRDAVVQDGPLSAAIHAFEPPPDKFTDAMIASKWWWAFMMALHFIGLSLIVGVMAVLDLRILGFAKQLPIGPLNRFIPWALLGLVVNNVTGMLAFMGMPVYYTYDAAFWAKMLALVLAGANIGAFYLTGTFDRVERLGPGDDAPMAAKLIAASSLFLWFAVLVCGRYIQLFQESISSGS